MREVTTTISSRDFFGPLSKARRRFRYLKARIGIGGGGKRTQRILVGGALLKGVNDTKRQDSSIHYSMGNRKIVIPTITVCVLTYVHIGDDSAKKRGLAVFFSPLFRVTFQFHISSVAAAANSILPRRSSHSICPEMTPMISHPPSIPLPLLLTYLRGLVNPACIVDS